MISHRYLFITAGAIFILIIAAWIGRQRYQPVDDGRYFVDSGWDQQQRGGQRSSYSQGLGYSGTPSRWSEITPEERTERLNRLLDEQVQRLKDQSEQYDALSATLRQSYLDELLDNEFEQRQRRRLQRWHAESGISANQLLQDRLAALPPDVQEQIHVFRKALDDRWETQRTRSHD